ncbi:hypothetical protein ABZ733_14370 [Streptomyces longwoodensis]|uniref:hypothetical protein n=1 Tax=Streptomyces longwoodensis TaxID=68231 RepID=UPI00340F308F
MSSEPRSESVSTDAPTPARSLGSSQAPAPLTVGVEEEFLLIEPHSRALSPHGPELVIKQPVNSVTGSAPS